MQILNQTNFDFVRWRWHAIALSLLVILAGAATIWTRGLSLGVDFAGGSIVIVKFEQGTPVERVRAAINNMPNGVGNDAVVQEYGEPAQHMVMIRVAQTAAQSSGNLSADADVVVEALKQANVDAFGVAGTEIVAADETFGAGLGQGAPELQARADRPVDAPAVAGQRRNPAKRIGRQLDAAG